MFLHIRLLEFLRNKNSVKQNRSQHILKIQILSLETEFNNLKINE